MGEVEVHPAYKQRHFAALNRAIMATVDPLDAALDVQVRCHKFGDEESVRGFRIMAALNFYITQIVCGQRLEPILERVDTDDYLASFTKIWVRLMPSWLDQLAEAKRASEEEL